MHKALPVAVAALLGLSASVAAAQSLRGSRASVERMYREAVRHDLHFYQTSVGVRRAVGKGVFVRLSSNSDYRLGAVSHAHVLPATRTFVQRLAAQYHSTCGERLVVTSGTRPRSVRLVNSVGKSVHPTGMAIDLRKPPYGRCLSWLRETLEFLEGEGVIEATEEHRPPHFHVAVFPDPYARYLRGQGGSPRWASAGAEAEETRTYRVRRGDSLSAIALREKVSVDRLRSANALRSSRILAGQRLVIPR